MRKILLTAVLALCIELVQAQAPEMMSYQAVVRNTSGQVIQNQSVAVRVSILQGSNVGPVVYSERITGITNTNGLLSTAIGTGTVISGTLNTINWSSGNYYLKTETDPTGGTSYTISGASQLLSVPYALYAKSSGSGGGSFTLPYTSTLTNPSALFSLANNGDGTSLEGINNTTTANITAIKGIINSTTPGGFSAGIRGINNGTGGLGIGVYGSHDGSGWGVYGVTPNGLGVYGNSSGNGYGVYANSNTGIGLNATSNNGVAAALSILNNTNNNNVLNANTVGNGTVINVTSTGNGRGVISST